MPDNPVQQLSAPDLAKWLVEYHDKPFVLLDVREQWEFDLCHLPDSIHIPMNDITSRVEELSSSTPTVCVCHHGIRSARVAMFLASQGFTKLYNLQGGIDAWSRLVDPSCPKY